jgi:carboxypeptidase Q
VKTPVALLFVLHALASAQTFPVEDPVIKRIWAEAMDSSQLPTLAHHLLDVIGPRLVGTPQMVKANTWAVDQYRRWGIEATNEQYGTWRGWERGISRIDLMQPRVRTLEGTMLAWSPATKKGGVTAPLLILADNADSTAFIRWLPSVRGKFVLISQPQPTGRPDKNWEEFATKESFDSLKAVRDRIKFNWERRVKVSGVRSDTLQLILEQAGAAGVITCEWSSGWGVYRIFGTITEKIPAVTLSLEDYNLLFRLVEHGDNPLVRIETESKKLDPMPAYNTLGTMRGAGLPRQYIMLSAHLDSWDGASGTTDNGTGTLIMMESMRVLRKCYPLPRRTILAGHWGSEEQGLNGSRAFVKDHPEIADSLQVLFNQDNGTGRITSMSGGGLVNVTGNVARWLSRIPVEVTQNIKMNYPGGPAGGGTDNASFAGAGVPGLGVGSLNWDYFSYTWHTNRDTYDKLVFDELKNNVVLVACLAYLASEDPEFLSRERRVLPPDKQTGKPGEWPKLQDPERRGGLPRLPEKQPEHNP